MPIKFVLLLVTIATTLPFTVLGQGIGDLGAQSTLDISPTFPQPGEIVTVKINDYASGMSGSQITWTYNGESVPDTDNNRSIEVIAGELGGTDVIEARMIPTFGEPQLLRTELKPVYLDIVIEPQTRVPDWYRGRAMPSIGSQINATVIVNNGSVVDPAGLIYTWQVDRDLLDAGPVRGRNQMSFATPRGSSFILSVSVSRSTGGTLARRAIRVESVSPFLSFYEQHPLYGSSLFPTNTNTSIIGNTLAVRAEPFFLDTRVYNDPDIAEWEINGRKTDNGARNPYEITLQRGATTGQTSANFHVRSLQSVLQGAEQRINLTF